MNVNLVSSIVSIDCVVVNMIFTLNTANIWLLGQVRIDIVYYNLQCIGYIYKDVLITTLRSVCVRNYKEIYSVVFVPAEVVFWVLDREWILPYRIALLR